MNDVIHERESIKAKYERLRAEFTDYKDKSQRIIISNEENYNKVFKENQALKADIRINKEKIDSEHLNNTVKKAEVELQNTQRKSLTNIGNVNVKLITENGKMEYLKNITLKYLESIALGNEFQSKMLENVIFSVLNVSNIEKSTLDEKRWKSSFYYSWWYNAKSYISSKLYGQSQDDTYNTPRYSISNPFTSQDNSFKYEESKVNTFK